MSGDGQVLSLDGHVFFVDKKFRIYDYFSRNYGFRVCLKAENANLPSEAGKAQRKAEEFMILRLHLQEVLGFVLFNHKHKEICDLGIDKQGERNKEKSEKVRFKTVCVVVWNKRRRLHFVDCRIVILSICLKQEQICSIYRNCLDIRAVKQQRYIPILVQRVYKKINRLFMICNKKNIYIYRLKFDNKPTYKLTYKRVSFH